MSVWGTHRKKKEEEVEEAEEEGVEQEQHGGRRCVVSGDGVRVCLQFHEDPSPDHIVICKYLRVSTCRFPMFIFVSAKHFASQSSLS